jgi:nitrogen fixation NifU-like protein
VYSERLLEHFQNPRHVGEVDDADIRAEVSNPICGDILRLTAKVVDGRIERIAYQTRGCTASIAAGSALTELLMGKTDDEALRLSRDDVEHAVGGLSNESKHAAVLAIDGVKALVRGWPT